MEAKHWEEVRRIFEEVVELPEGERAERLASSCQQGTDLWTAVMHMLSADACAGAFLEPVHEQAAVDTPPFPAEGARVGGYELVHCIATGGMGTVYEARQRNPSRTVAVKMLLPELTSSRLLGRFREEAETLARLRHPGIAQVYEAGLHVEGHGALARELPWIALEFVEGARPITAFVQEEGLDTHARLELFGRVCDAIHYGHQRGVIHRDVKPGNLLVDSSGRSRVIDFGIAHVIDAEADRTHRTAAGEVLGTLQYMSPEQVSGDPRELDTRCDVYGLGAVLYELLCGRRPRDLDDLSLPGALIAVCEGAVPPLRAARPDLSSELEWIVARALEPERERRYGSAADLAADLRRHLAHEPLEAGPASAMYRVRKLARRHWVGATASVTILISLLVGLIAVILVESKGRREVLRMSDGKRLTDYLAEADRLGPPHPERVAPMLTWLRKARELAARSGEHRSALAELRAGALEITGQGQELAYEFRSAEEAWRHEMLAKLLIGLEDLENPEGGPIAEVERRVELAREIAARTLDDHAAAWQRARRSIADRRDCPIYDGLEIAPQLGLIPIGRDPGSGLWEFAHWLSGETPRVDAAGRWELEPQSAVILVLLPGGAFDMGAVPPAPGQPVDAPNADVSALWEEAPVHRVELAPFFVSKYEMTQAQWIRLTGENPSAGAPGTTYESVVHTTLHPVESVAWAECERVAFLAGLGLPTEAQWEYAARAGEGAPWSSGQRRALLEGCANVADRALLRQFPEMDIHTMDWPQLDDGFALHAPVGSFRPNGFGLYDVHGNVYEWCRDAHVRYEIPVEGPAGLRPGPGLGERIVRGGAWNRRVRLARSSSRSAERPDNRLGSVGLRPVRPLRD